MFHLGDKAPVPVFKGGVGGVLRQHRLRSVPGSRLLLDIGKVGGDFVCQAVFQHAAQGGAAGKAWGVKNSACSICSREKVMQESVMGSISKC